ncbi:GGDEF domain-containing protein [Polynucleobacter sp. AP-Capit-er-40B-B4]|uniref:GGDEF domain-containing protein n=1 Tax=Polynucleobacter sp. AP-Capit-er-40B-B4 TaxID=2576927 RepID=UPI001C0ABD56|nr:GGDEF domain-containing protein [Polynucleobacter sp. AP-Capit-er-40B-B4]MBU3582285.1 GGDEF domain-containing protein [Polynucleobacter sp. AP-Capit-er-40B-B4]
MNIIIRGADSPFGIKPKFAVVFGFCLLGLILLIDVVSPFNYRFVLLYLFPAAIIALNAKSLKVVVLALIVSTLFENYFLFREGNFEFGFTPVDTLNFSIRFLATLLIIWLARSLRRSQLRVNQMANTDSLTGLWNRRRARMVIEQAIARLEGRGEIFSVALIDVNNFKKINDLRGHLVGDQVLTKIAHELLKFASDSATFYRLGGDEFLVIALNLSEEQMKKLSEEIVSKVNQAMQEFGYSVSLSIGSATYNQPPKSVSDILHQVDLAMYRHKAQPKSVEL